MNYAHFLIRQKRLDRNWSQEGLCKGICTASYLSKIEQGKAEPSEEVIRLLFQRMGIEWNDKENGCSDQMLKDSYEFLLTGDQENFYKIVKSELWQKYENSPWGLDYLLLNRYAEPNAGPMEESLEICMSQKQLALQRNLQGRWEEAIRLFPCGYLYVEAGKACYHNGNTTQAIELLQTAHQLAAEEGSVRIMLMARITMGSCYSNLQDTDSMKAHYQVAKRLAVALGAKEELKDISYNEAATQIELGQYQIALDYFEHCKNPNAASLHKLAICYEKLGNPQKALEALERADVAEHFLPDNMEEKMCRLVKLRLTDKYYLDSEVYGTALMDCFKMCKQHLPAGYAIFHLPWVLEWYEYHRQYKCAYDLLLDFPEYRRKK